MTPQFFDPPPKLNIQNPQFSIGDRVRVRVGGCNKTPRKGSVRSYEWHFKEKQYYYYIEQDGKPVKKRYLTEDLERVTD
jgi:hypothetical protein